ncbi:cellulase family glycosylhydrolase [Saccharibacillus sp. CPCC 101409]|uniref:cellulase family glycosylhydrolase n=1 Tax=Saccharibacillus sp. CPCC 101409 TaxID=3058041 RepID=UPI0026713421|nr:cellulase family glycosylhydrolase [Saccharibacillus sp. CPCC 101409]MDO3408168.1 cellulase family glycosylhydrolase [Saccharibacillus sp. CPCC 101409]
MFKNRFAPVFSLVLAAALLISLLPAGFSASAASASPPKSKMQTYVDNMQPGWNLGNTLDSVGADETAWGNPRVTRELIKQISRQGFNSIRIPVTWDNHIGPAPDYKIDPAYLDRVAEVVGWARTENLYVLINVHHDSWVWISKMENDHDQTLARYNAVWKQIADKFKNESDKLSFESVNEPRFTDGGTTDEATAQKLLDELNLSFHEIVRASGGKNATRPLVLPTLESSPTQDRMNALSKTFEQLKADKNLIATVHYYGYWPFSVNIAGTTRFDETTQKDITTTFDNVYNTFTAKGIPVILGEYGLLGFDKNVNVIEQGEKLKFFEFLTAYLKEKHITGMWWDNGQHFSRTQYTWSDPELYEIIRSGQNQRSAVAESDLIYLRQGDKIADVSVQLQLNGNKLTSLKADGKRLVRNKEYRLDGETLTIPAATLERLTASGKLGVNSVLTAGFTKGPDWNFYLTVFAKPVLSQASGTTADFAIPTAFNGDKLATMEAVYVSGGNAGPQDWTSYKEFETTFSPDYAGGKIVLRPDLLNTLRDGEAVKLTFYFWSGEKVTYILEKNGSNVSGRPAE